MGESAFQLMSLADFLCWDAPGPMPWQLFEGHPVAMAPPGDDHGTVVANIARLIGNQLTRRPPCRVRVEAGVILPHRGRSYYVADLAVSCQPVERGRSDIPEPLLIIEVLSPTTENDDRKIKLPDYRMLTSVQEILYIDPTRAYCELHRRLDESRWETELLTRLDDHLRLGQCEQAIPLTDVYANVALDGD